MFSIINKYIIASISKGIVLSSSVFLALLILIGFIQQMNAVGKGTYTIGGALFYTLLNIPSNLYDTFPVSGVVGVMIGLGALAASSELVIIQTVGTSRLKIAWMTTVTLILWLIPLSIIGEYIVPPAKTMAESYRSAKMSKNVGIGVNTGVWIRDGNVIFNATPVGNVYDIKNKNIVMNDVTVYELDDNLQVAKVSKAEKAQHVGTNWLLSNIEVTEFIEAGVTTKILETQSWPSRIEPEILSITRSRPKHLSIRDILKYKKFQTDKISTPIKYDIALWSKLTYPLLVVAIALSGLPFIFGLVRSGGFGQRLLIGMMLGMILYYLNRILLNMGEVFHVYPVFVTALPATIILLMVLLYLKKDKIS
jgi:lipopolysaccharide export system permease protein